MEVVVVAIVVPASSRDVDIKMTSARRIFRPFSQWRSKVVIPILLKKEKANRLILFYTLNTDLLFSCVSTACKNCPKRQQQLQKDNYNCVGYILVLNHCPRFRNQDAYETWAMIQYCSHPSCMDGKRTSPCQKPTSLASG